MKWDREIAGWTEIDKSFLNDSKLFIIMDQDWTDNWKEIDIVWKVIGTLYLLKSIWSKFNREGDDLTIEVKLRIKMKSNYLSIKKYHS